MFARAMPSNTRRPRASSIHTRMSPRFASASPLSLASTSISVGVPACQLDSTIGSISSKRGRSDTAPTIRPAPLPAGTKRRRHVPGAASRSSGRK